MKKVMVVLLMGALMFTMAGNVLALDEDVAVSETKVTRLQMQEERRFEREQRQEDREVARAARLAKLKEFSDELDQLNALQRENLSLRIDINTAHQELRHLLLAAMESENQEALEAAREARQELSTLNEEIRNLQVQLKDERQEYQDALKNDLIPEAQSHLDNMLETKESINAKLRIKIDLLQRIITILS